MSDYISREAAIAYIREQSEELQKAFEELGGESGIYADAYKVRNVDGYRYDDKPNYCPSCGAKMDLEELK